MLTLPRADLGAQTSARTPVRHPCARPEPERQSAQGTRVRADTCSNACNQVRWRIMTTWRSLAWTRLTAPLAGTCLLAALAWGCGAEVNRAPAIEGNTNWLRHCEVDSDCGAEQRCLCNTCTAACAGDSDCSRLGAPSLQCLTASAGAQQCDAAQAGLCSLACQTDADCTGDLTCVTGLCLASSPSPASLPENMTMADASPPPELTMPAPVTPPTAPSFMPAARCELPFSVGSCDASFTLYAYENGQCVARTGCWMSDPTLNSFFTLEECWADCERRPSARSCPEGTEARTICLACGLFGGCSREAEVCASPCTRSDECTYFGPGTCIDGFCTAGLCF